MFGRIFIAGALAASSANAFFRMPCSQPVVVERSDPIVNPGALSGHLHTIMGGSAFNFSQTYEQARAASCTSCKAKQDKSNYWTPTLFYQAQDGKFHQVAQNGGATIYYLQRKANDNEQLLPFPPGFRMLAGDPGLRSYNGNSLAQQAVSYVCLNYNGQSPQTPGIPNMNCPNGLRSQIFFPSCWDGVNLDSPNHKDHVAYPDRMDNGACPPTHPKRLISIFYEIIWKTEEWAGQWWHADGSHPFVLSMGDPTGYGFHGDFLNGWDIPALQTAIDKCTQNSGVIEDCQQHLELLSNAEMQDCVNPSRVDEDISGWLDSLPGCNPVQSGPGRATAQSCPQKTTPAILSLDEVAFIKQDIPFWDGVGCAQDSLNNRLLPKKFTDPAMTIEKCLDTCHSNGFAYAGLQWGVECWCGNTFDESKANLKGKCNQPCAGDASEMCGNGQVLSVYRYNPNKASTPSNPTTPTTTSTTAAPTTTTTTAATTSSSAPVSNPAGGSGGSNPPGPTTSPTTTVSLPTPTNTSTTSSGSGSGSGGSGPTSGHAPTGWVYRGCFIDPLTPRALPDGMWYGVPMTPQACTDHCAERGYLIAGTEYSGECFCGNAFVNHGGKVKQVEESQCNMPCKGDQGIICGGPARLSVYTKGNYHINAQEFTRTHPQKREASPNPDGLLNTTKSSKRTESGAHVHGRLRNRAHNRISFADNLLN